MTLAGGPFTVNDGSDSETFETLEAALDGLLLRGVVLDCALTMCARLALCTNPMIEVFDWLLMGGQDAARALMVVGKAVLAGDTPRSPRVDG